MALKNRAFFSGTDFNEDPIRTGVTGKPVIHSAIHPRRQESMFNQIYACRDALFDPHSDTVNITKSTIIGAFIGGAVGYTSTFLLKRVPTFAMRKAFKHIRDNQFGSAHIFKDSLMPYMLGGAATGFSYFMFWKVIWGEEHSKLYNTVLGNAVFSSLATSILYNPKYWWAGLYAGGLAGIFIYTILYRNDLVKKDSGNVILKLSGLSEEDREKIKYKDLIHELGMNPVIEQTRLVHL